MDAEHAKAHIKEVRSLRKELAKPLHDSTSTAEDKDASLFALNDYRKLLRNSDPDYRQSVRIVSDLRREHFDKKKEVEEAFDLRELEAFNLLNKYVNPDLNSDSRAKAKKSFYSYCDTGLGYTILSSLLNTNLEVAKTRGKNTPRARRYSEILDEIKERYSVSDVFKVNFVFELHGVPANQDAFLKKQKESYEKMKTVFNKEGRNVVFLENATNGVEFDNYFQEVYRRFGSATLANIVTVQDLAPGVRKPSQNFIQESLTYDLSEREVAKITRDLEEHFTPNDASRYLLAICKAIDKLKSEGYDIDIMWERSPEDDLSTQALNLIEGKFEGTIDQFKETFNELASHGVMREVGIANHLCSEALKAKSSKKRANLIAFLGTTHNSLTAILPPYLTGSIDSASSSTEGVDSLHMTIIALLKYGISPPENFWNSEYARPRLKTLKAFPDF